LTSNLDFCLREIKDQRLKNEHDSIKNVCTGLIADFESYVRNELHIAETSISSIRMENGKYHVEAMKHCKELVASFKNFEDFKNSIEVEIEKKISQMIEIETHFNTGMSDLRKAEKSRNEILEEIKVM